MLLEVYLKLNKIERLIHKENLETARLYGPLSDISHGQGRILAYLKTKEPMSIKELAELMEIRPQSLNDHLRRMQRDGLIIREPSLEDRRKVLISLTPKARDLDISYKSYETIFNGLTDDEIEELSLILDKIENNLKFELGDEIIDEPHPGPVGRIFIPGDHPKPVPPHLRGSEYHPVPPHLRGPEDHPIPPHLRGVEDRPIKHRVHIVSDESLIPPEVLDAEEMELPTGVEGITEDHLKDYLVSILEENLESIKQELRKLEIDEESDNEDGQEE